jgi:hypothetical protein
VTVPAIVAAGDRRAAKDIRGESKPYLEIAGRPLVMHTVLALQGVPEVSEVWVVGNARRLEAVLGGAELRGLLRKRLTIVPQFRNLFENVWQTYRRALPGAGPAGRDPGPEDDEGMALFLSADLPFATPEEISAFVRSSYAASCDYALGITSEAALADFHEGAPGEPGIDMAYFNLREGRFRQNNLHLVRPTRLGNRHYIEEMYEHRYQREIGNIIALAWRILWSEGGGPTVLFYYALMHLAGMADRWGWRTVADTVRRWVPIRRIEVGVSKLLRTRFRFVATEAGGCAVDIDNEKDFEAALRGFERWRPRQIARARELYGPLALAAGEKPVEVRVLPGGTK